MTAQEEKLDPCSDCCTAAGKRTIARQQWAQQSDRPHNDHKCLITNKVCLITTKVNTLIKMLLLLELVQRTAMSVKLDDRARKITHLMPL